MTTIHGTTISAAPGAANYATLAQVKQRLLQAHTYTATTLSFNASTKVIADTLKGLKRFQTGDWIQVSGSTSNDGYYTVATGNTPAQIVVTEALGLTEIAGDSVTITALNDLTDDATLEAAIEAVSRWIDEHCGWRFYTTASDETRYYTAERARKLEIPEGLLTLTTLACDQDGDRTYEETWAATDYDLTPANAVLDSMPYTHIERSPLSRYGFSRYARGVKVIGKFGYAATAPKAVTEACILLAVKVFKRKDSPLGVAGFPEIGEVRNLRALDPDAVALLVPYRKAIN